MLNLARAIELVSKLSRTGRYPTTSEGVDGLARGLQYASDSTQIGAGRIIERCAQISEWCPTDADLLTVARDLQREDAVAAGTYDSMGNAPNRAVPIAELEKIYGPPQKVNVSAEMKTLGAKAQNRHKIMWAKIRKHLRLSPREDWPSWEKCAAVARELGYDDYAQRWEESQVGSPKYYKARRRWDI